MAIKWCLLGNLNNSTQLCNVLCWEEHKLVLVSWDAGRVVLPFPVATTLYSWNGKTHELTILPQSENFLTVKLKTASPINSFMKLYDEMKKDLDNPQMVSDPSFTTTTPNDNNQEPTPCHKCKETTLLLKQLRETNERLEQELMKRNQEELDQMRTELERGSTAGTGPSDSQIIRLKTQLTAARNDLEYLQGEFKARLTAAKQSQATTEKDLKNALNEVKKLKMEKEELARKTHNLQVALQQTQQELHRVRKPSDSMISSAEMEEWVYVDKGDVAQKNVNISNSEPPQQSSSLNLEQAQMKIAQLEKEISTLSTSLAKLSGMRTMGDAALSRINDFKDLRDNDLTNLVFSMTDDDNVQSVLFPLLSRIAFNEFWSLVLEDDSTDQRVRYSKLITEKDEKVVSLCVNKLRSALTTILKNLQRQLTDCDISHLVDSSGSSYQQELCDFFDGCTRWNAAMTLCDPVLELLPKSRLPKQGTPINNLVGQQFEYDFGDLGNAVVDCVELPGLAVQDLTGTVYCKARIRCKFPSMNK